MAKRFEKETMTSLRGSREVWLAVVALLFFLLLSLLFR